MLDQIRKHLQTWLGVPLLSPLHDQIQTLEDRMDFLERRIRISPGDPREEPPEPLDVDAVPDAHLGAH